MRRSGGMDRPLFLIEDPTRGPLLAQALAATLGEPVRPLHPSQTIPAIPGDFLIAAERPGRCGLELGGKLLQSAAGHRVLLWSPSPSDLYLRVARLLGFAGYLDCAASWAENLRWLQAFRAGQEAWPPDLRARADRFEAAIGDLLRKLRPEEAGRLADLARPLPWKMRAARWGMSREGARRAAQRLEEKFMVEGSEAVVAPAWAGGLLKATPEGPVPAPALLLALEALSHS